MQKASEPAELFAPAAFVYTKKGRQNWRYWHRPVVTGRSKTVSSSRLGDYFTEIWADTTKFARPQRTVASVVLIMGTPKAGNADLSKGTFIGKVESCSVKHRETQNLEDFILGSRKDKI